jgi:hypothetical protein
MLVGVAVGVAVDVSSTPCKRKVWSGPEFVWDRHVVLRPQSVQPELKPFPGLRHAAPLFTAGVRRPVHAHLLPAAVVFACTETQYVPVPSDVEGTAIEYSPFVVSNT